ncbi:hypothetical protein LguiA_018098 [Lonicera macranthoides]
MASCQIEESSVPHRHYKLNSENSRRTNRARTYGLGNRTVRTKNLELQIGLISRNRAVHFFSPPNIFLKLQTNNNSSSTTTFYLSHRAGRHGELGQKFTMSSLFVILMFFELSKYTHCTNQKEKEKKNLEAQLHDLESQQQQASMPQVLPPN